jgi:hypothetical protein
MRTTGSDYAYSGHATVDNKVCAGDEATLIACEEENCVCLLCSLAEPASWEMDFPTSTLCRIVSEPILEEWCAVQKISFW